jgi:predicted DNA-binding transcriptional regulator AlpA
MLCIAQDRAVTETLDLITTTEAAQILGVDRATVSRWSSAKLLPEARKLTPAARIGGYAAFRRADVEALRDEMATKEAS